MASLKQKLTTRFFETAPLGVFSFLEAALKQHAHLIRKRHLSKIVSDLLDDVTSVSNSDRILYSTVLENAKSELLDNHSHSRLEIPAAKFLLGINKLVLDQLLHLKPLMGLQSITAPVGLVYALNVKDGRCEVSSIPTEASIKRFQTSISIEAMQDFLVVANRTGYNEFEKVVAEQCAIEIADTLLEIVLSKAKVYKVDGNLAESLTLASSTISADTGRGNGNVIVASSERLHEITSIPGFSAEFVDLETRSPLLTYVGKTADQIKVYVSTLQSIKNKIIICYRGSLDVDTGFLFCPYKLVSTSGMVVDPNTFAPKLPLASRSAVYSDRESSTSDNNRYFAVIE